MAILASAGILGDKVRVDANNLWNSADEAIRDLTSLAPGFCAIEEPLPAGDFPGMRKIMEAIDISTILDESFLRLDQFPQIEGDPHRWLLNLRVSKMGGLFRSIEIAKLARAKGVRLIVGAQVGETSLLTRAALTVAQFADGNLYAQEGAFGTRLIESDITPSPLMFGQGGKLPLDKNPDWRLPLPIVRPSQFLKGEMVGVAERTNESLL
ncbi:MAG: hypothetical protein EXS31_16310 [Pedosphaera sp.]|nr:hypothetical protein [Pedosphaera sp.]